MPETMSRSSALMLVESFLRGGIPLSARSHNRLGRIIGSLSDAERQRLRAASVSFHMRQELALQRLQRERAGSAWTR